MPQAGSHMPQAQTQTSAAPHLPCAPADWLEQNVSPAGPVTALFLLKDPLFMQAPPGLRQQMLLEKRTELAELIDNDMRSGKLMRMRRKMHEWLSAPPATLSADTLADVWDILCTVTGVQTICVEDRSADGIAVHFAPADVTTWHSDRPIHVVEKSLRKVWTYVGAPNRLRQGLLGWLSNVEAAGAKIHYPTSEKSKAELVEFLEVLPTWKESMRKMKKDELAVIAGRAATLELFSEWQTLTPQQRFFNE